jgi:Flp pilus assembly protein TadD
VAVESVAWTTERKNVLSGLFYLLSTLAYLRFRPLTGQSRDLDWRSYSLVLGLFLAALLSKTVTCTLPVVLVLTTWWKQGRVEKRDALVLAPLFVLGAGLGLVTVWMEKRHVGAAGAEWSLSFIQRCLLAGRAVWFYAGKLVWPANLTFIYPRWEIDATVLWQYFFPLAGFGLLIVMWWVRGKIGRGPLVAALIFVVGLGPALGFVDVYPFRYSFVADHFQYLACIGLIVLITGISATILQQAGRWGHDLGSGAGVAVLAGLGFLTWQQTHIYRDVETLWRDTLRKNPQAWMAHDNLAIELTKAGRLNEAIQHFQYTLNVRPNDEDAHYNFGLALWQQGLKQEAMEHWRHALEIKPDFPEVHNNLGVALMETGLLEESIDHYHQALRLRPNDANAHYNLGVALWRSSRFQEAIQSYQRALQIDPDYAEARYNLGTTLEQTGRLLEAIEHYEQILRLNPNSPELRKRVERLRAAQ